VSLYTVVRKALKLELFRQNIIPVGL